MSVVGGGGGGGGVSVVSTAAWGRMELTTGELEVTGIM